MLRSGKTAALVLLALTEQVRADAPTSDTLIHYAECLGAGDQYARDAAVYGYDSTAQDARAEAQMAQMLAHPLSPGEARLLRARREGRVTYAALGQALQGQTEGPAWDTFVAFSIRCGETRDRLEQSGIITEP